MKLYYWTTIFLVIFLILIYPVTALVTVVTNNSDTSFETSTVSRGYVDGASLENGRINRETSSTELNEDVGLDYSQQIYKHNKYRLAIAGVFIAIVTIIKAISSKNIGEPKKIILALDIIIYIILALLIITTIQATNYM